MRKMIALLLCLCMLAGLLAGCGGSRIVAYEDENAAAEETVAADANPPEEGAAQADPGLGFAAYAADTVVGTVAGEDVTWEEYYYWLSYYVEYVQYLAAVNGLALSGWDAYELSADNTNAQVVLINAQYAVTQYHAMSAKAAELGITLDDEDQATLAEYFAEAADLNAGDGDGTCTEEESAAFEEMLAEQNMTRAFFDYLNEVTILNNKAFVTLYGETGELLPDEEALAFAEEQDVLAAKHILLLTMDMTTGEALSDEEIAEKQALIDDIYAQLSAVADDPEALNALFDELMAQYTEDTGYASYPEGYIFTPGTMVTSFEDAVTAMEAGGLSEVVESEYGYHIIMRLPIDPDSTYAYDSYGQPFSLRYAIASDVYTSLVNTWTDEAQVTWNEGFEDLDIAAIFGG